MQGLLKLLTAAEMKGTDLTLEGHGWGIWRKEIELMNTHIFLVFLNALQGLVDRDF